MGITNGFMKKLMFYKVFVFSVLFFSLSNICIAQSKTTYWTGDGGIGLFLILRKTRQAFL